MTKPLRGLWKLTWLEIKIFAREPMGLVGSLVMPVVVFIALGRLLSGLPSSVGTRPQGFLQTGLPVLAAIMIAVNGIISLVTIISIYREGGILKRLRATPLSPATILTAHVIVKLAFTALTLALLLLVGKRYYPVDVDPPLLSFAVALLLSTWSLLSIGFLIASVVPTARFAQPIAGLVLYPLLGLSGLFVAITAFPPALELVARLNPFTYAVSLLQGIWRGEAWSAHLTDVAALAAVFALCTALSSRVFRWQ